LRHAAGIAAVSSSLASIMLALEPAIGSVDVIENGVDGNGFLPKTGCWPERKSA